MTQERIALETVRRAYTVLHNRYLDVVTVGDQLASIPPDVTQFEGLGITHPPVDEVLLEKAPEIMALFANEASK